MNSKVINKSMILLVARPTTQFSLLSKKESSMLICYSRQAFKIYGQKIIAKELAQVLFSPMH